MPKLIDLTGQRYGKLVVTGRAPSDGRQSCWTVRCTCGADKIVRGKSLTGGITVTCGAAGCRRRTHGQSNTPEYKTWQSMLQRCCTPTANNYARYGGRGIRVCERWLMFEHFFSDMGPRPSPRHSIDRKNNDLGYWCGKCEECVGLGRLENCRWATAIQQQNNRGHFAVIDGRYYSFMECALRIGISEQALRSRLRRGWSLDRALTQTPAIGKNPFKGSDVKNAKLSDERVCSIRARSAAGERHYLLAKEFGISDTEISRIVHRRCWKHVV